MPRRVQARSRAGVLPAPAGLANLAGFGRFLPSPMSLLVGVCVVLLAAAAYAAARFTPLFAIRSVEVVGVAPADAARVRNALEPLQGTSLVGLGGEDVERRVAALPQVASVSYDRAFPHTLRLVVRAERPVLVLRRGSESWLVSARGRVIETIRPRGAAGLPRTWVRRSTELRPGEPVAGGALAGARALGTVKRMQLELPVRAVAEGEHGLVLVLRSGLEIRLGGPRRLRLKLAVAAAALAQVQEGAAYLDVTVPERPVAGPTLKSKVDV